MHQSIESPNLLIYDDIIEKNISFMQSKADYYGLKLRPHVKTHKSVFLANKQLDAGAIGITCSQVEEALTFIENDFKSITVAYPIISKTKLKKLLAAANEAEVDLNLIIDNIVGFHILCDALIDTGLVANTYLKIDVGLHRCGIDPENPKLESLAYFLDAEPTINFMGILSHAGHSYSAKNKEELDLIILDEISIMKDVKSKLNAKGIDVKNVSIGATPSVLQSTNFEGVTEIRPGNYILMDQTPLHLELIKEDQIAIRVLATIISENDLYYIADIGSKVLSSDKGAHGQSTISNYGIAYPINSIDVDAHFIEKLSEEHAFIPKTSESDLTIGDQILVIPNHSCAVMNQFSEFIYFADKAYKHIPVDARR